MAMPSPEEFLKEHGEKSPEVANGGCIFLCNEYESVYEQYEETTNPKLKFALLQKLTSIARLRAQMHCPPCYPQ